MKSGIPHVWDLLPRPLSNGPAVLAGAGATCVVTALCIAVAGWLPSHGVAMFYILAVVAMAVAFGTTAGIATATAAFLAYNFFFVHPTFTFTISDPRDLLALLIFFAVAVATGSLAGRMRDVAEQARQKSQSLETLNALALRLSRAMSEGDVASALMSQSSQAVAVPACLLRVSGQGLTPWTQMQDDPVLNTADWQAAQRAASIKQNVYPAVDGWSGPRWQFYPVLVRNSAVAVLGLNLLRSNDAEHATIEAMVHQAATAFERLSLEAEKRAVEREVETERLRSALLASVSHDIKTPLAAIQGAATSLRELGSRMPESSKSELVTTIEEEAVRLSRFVTNMLDMMRFQSGPPAIKNDWVDLADTLGATVAHARKMLPAFRIRLDVAVAPAIVLGDETLLERVFLNVIENSANASKSGGEIKVALCHAQHGFNVVVEDYGTGIAPADLPRIFEKFYRAPCATARGSGLGLAISKEVMTALGGTISVASPITGLGGTRLTLYFPCAEQPSGEGTLQ